MSFLRFKDFVHQKTQSFLGNFASPASSLPRTPLEQFEYFRGRYIVGRRVLLTVIQRLHLSISQLHAVHLLLRFRQDGSDAEAVVHLLSDILELLLGLRKSLETTFRDLLSLLKARLKESQATPEENPLAPKLMNLDDVEKLFVSALAFFCESFAELSSKISSVVGVRVSEESQLPAPESSLPVKQLIDSTRTIRSRKFRDVARTCSRPDLSVGISLLDASQKQRLGSAGGSEQLSEYDLSELIPRKIYIGNCDGAANLRLLRNPRFGISTVVNCTVEIPNHFRRRFSYVHLPLADVEDQRIAPVLQRLIEVVDSCEGAVFIHCVGGISRSPCLAIGYCMKKNHWRFWRAFKFVREKRRCIFPNRGFVQQLLEVERELFGDVEDPDVYDKIPAPEDVVVVRGGSSTSSGDQRTVGDASRVATERVRRRE